MTPDTMTVCSQTTISDYANRSSSRCRSRRSRACSWLRQRSAPRKLWKPWGIARWGWAARSWPSPPTAARPGGIPAGLATGPFVGRGARAGVTDLKRPSLPARRDRVSWFAATAPAVRIQLLPLTNHRHTADSGLQDSRPVDREDRRAGVSVRSLSASELGVTLVQSILPGVHAGTTLKYVRGTLRSGVTMRRGRRRTARQRRRAGRRRRREPLRSRCWGARRGGSGAPRGGRCATSARAEFGGDGAIRAAAAGAGWRRRSTLSKRAAPPLTLALDADVRTYATASGDRRVVAVGAEQWLAGEADRCPRRARGSTRSAREERAATAGASVAVRTGMYVEGHVVRGGAATSAAGASGHE